MLGEEGNKSKSYTLTIIQKLLISCHHLGLWLDYLGFPLPGIGLLKNFLPQNAPLTEASGLCGLHLPECSASTSSGTLPRPAQVISGSCSLCAASGDRSGEGCPSGNPHEAQGHLVGTDAAFISQDILGRPGCTFYLPSASRLYLWPHYHKEQSIDFL